MEGESHQFWTAEIYQSRIADAGLMIRHAAGSPASEEIAVYLNCCAGADPDGTAVILGMTPELRCMAAGHFRKLVSIDCSEVAIQLYSDWLPQHLRAKETVICGRWTELSSLVDGPVSVVLGDGVVGNLSGPGETLSLLEEIRTVLAPAGCCVMRNAIVNTGVIPARYEFSRLLMDFRSGLIDAAEFAFSTRMLGFYECVYDTRAEMLDNAITYGLLDAMRDAGDLSDEEWEALGRYRFMGRNYFPSNETWRSLLVAAGFGNVVQRGLRGKLWYEYYPVHVFGPGL